MLIQELPALIVTLTYVWWSEILDVSDTLCRWQGLCKSTFYCVRAVTVGHLPSCLLPYPYFSTWRDLGMEN